MFWSKPEPQQHEPEPKHYDVRIVRNDYKHPNGNIWSQWSVYLFDNIIRWDWNCKGTYQTEDAAVKHAEALVKNYQSAPVGSVVTREWKQ